MTIAIQARRHRFSAGYDPRARRKRQGSPMGGMNVTPFIDVLLVLLIMIIMAVPIKVDQTTIELPGKPPIEATLPILAENTVFISQADQLFWNGQAVTREQLSTQVTAASAREDEPLLRFEPDALASYETSARTIVLIKEAGAERFAFVGNARHKDFGL